MNAKWYAEEAEEKGIRKSIKMLKNCNIEDHNIVEQLMQEYNLDREDAEDYLKEYYDER